MVLGSLACSPLAERTVSPEKTDLWEAGAGGYAHYRIPAIACTVQGSLLAFCEARKQTGGDWGAIDLMMRRSTDGGRTWETPRVIGRVQEQIPKNPVALAQGLAQPGQVTYNNSAPVLDRQTGAIHFLFCVEYARVYAMHSGDDGLTFSTPIDITPAAAKLRERYPWKVIATGPGHGIQLENGRLIVPIWMSTGTGGHAHRPSKVSVLYSDDHGATWNAGDLVAGEENPRNPSESIALELADGRVLLNMRNESPEHRRAVSYSPNGVSGWSPPAFDDELIEPICMASLLRLTREPREDRNRILFANPDSTEPRNPANPDGVWVRRNLTVRLSYDEGLTWPVKKALEPGLSGYSDMAVSPDGAIYVFYENGSPRGESTFVARLTLARLTLEWLTDGADELP